ncbi:TMEM165/GDT1 family protein [Legionella cardiaca]|uniref:GDT1 family protein n=1 Tax=Legionella cardiaca TaxID=1071983 RepID=A0ABY8APT7_9GAMM|nr:TMEM165/GDT1 family protein [Legionella cardiaca]WED42449.1 TMEM165/GDT1 family protein [Legionella cardiaca]
MESLFFSAGLVALAEFGDKTQLLAFILAARFKEPFPIILGILVATLINHGLAGIIGVWLISTLSPQSLRWLLGLSFIAMAIWILIPDKLEQEETKIAQNLGVFTATLISFFLAEMGDKTQLATVALTAHYKAPIMVIIGTTLGMLIADIPAVFLGEKLGEKIPIKIIRFSAAALFVLIAIVSILELDKFIFG